MGRPFLSQTGSKYHFETKPLAQKLLLQLLRHETVRRTVSSSVSGLISAPRC